MSNLLETMHRKRLFILGVGIGLITLFNPIFAQFSYFGKNKVQTRDYRFLSYETEHFKIIFYTGGEGIAEFAAHTAEDFYAKLRNDLNMELPEKIPLILYLSPGQFSETNVITDLIEEGVGGFSELIKNRIVVPFTGSYQELYHVIGHELSHIFQFQMFYRSRLSALLGAIGEFQVPLWIMEGFAEFQSGWVQVNSEIFMRDLVIHNRLLPLRELNDNYGYLAYRQGESFFNYVAERYGKQKVYEFLNTLRAKRNLGATFEAVFGMSQEKFGSEWEQYLRIKYLPQIVKLTNYEQLANKLTDHTKDGSVYNTAPAISPSGTKIAMISDRAEYVDCYLISAIDGRVIRRLIRGGRSGGFEKLHLLRPGVAWSPDERLLAIVATSAGRDNITLIDVNRAKVVRRITANLDGIYSPKFSPDGSQMAFVGLKNGFSDIYLISMAGGEPVRLTYDMYDDRDPAFSPSGDSVIFVSDRPAPGENWAPGQYAIWLRNENGHLHRLSQRAPYFSTPVFTHSGEYIFWVATDSASQNIYGYSIRQQKIVRRTDFLGAVSHLSLSKDDRKLSFAYFNDGGWDVSIIYEPLEKIPVDSSLLPAPMDTKRFVKEGLDFERVTPVGFNLSPDYVAGAASYSSGQGFAGTIYLGLSDIMGNHRFELYTDLYGNILNSNAFLTYWFLPYRIDYGFAVYQWFDIPYYRPGTLIIQTFDRGLQTTASYPFNRFSRVEITLNGIYRVIEEYRWKEGWYFAGSTTERIIYPAFAYVYDNTFWREWFSPARGTRLRLETGTSLFSTRQFENFLYDLRNYQALGKRFVFATRLAGAINWGEVTGYYLGGEHIRGYKWSEFSDQTGPALSLLNLELRYPFIDRLKLAFPLPIEIKGIRGVLFLDGGLVFRDSMQLWDSKELKDLKLGAGAGLRIPFTFFNIKLDFAYPLSQTAEKNWKFIFHLGYDF